MIHFEPHIKLLSKRRSARLRSARERADTMTEQATGSTVPRRQLGRYLRDLRGSQRITVKTAAEKLEWSETKVWRIETGQTSLRRHAGSHRGADGPGQGNQGQGLVARLRRRDPGGIRRLHRPGGGSITAVG